MVLQATSESTTVDQVTTEPAKAADPPLPGTATANYTLLVLGVVVMFTVLDRQVLSLMIEPIKADFKISDTQAALLLGAAFSLTYAFAGLPIARIADVSNRRNLIAICIAFWSAATMACGIAQNYALLFLARLGIGIGEAGYAPATWSIVTDTFPREKVAFATGTIAIGAQIGTGLALVLGGAALAFVEHLPAVEIPLVGAIRSWQWAFIIVGAPGLLWALVVMTMKEPARRGLTTAQRKKAVPVSEVARWMLNDWRSYGGIMGGSCVKYLLSMGTTQWMPTLFKREFHWDLTTIGYTQGVVIMLVSPLGLVLGGKLSERWTKRGVPAANMRIMLLALTATVPLSIIFPLVGNPYLMLALYGLNMFMAMMGGGPATASFQLITPNAMRAQVGAVSLFFVNVIAFALGPLVVALFTDFLFNDPQDLKYSMTLCAVILGPIACLLVLQAVNPYARSYERAMRDFS